MPRGIPKAGKRAPWGSKKIAVVKGKRGRPAKVSPVLTKAVKQTRKPRAVKAEAPDTTALDARLGALREEFAILHGRLDGVTASVKYINDTVMLVAKGVAQVLETHRAGIIDSFRQFFAQDENTDAGKFVEAIKLSCGIHGINEQTLMSYVPKAQPVPTPEVPVTAPEVSVTQPLPSMSNSLDLLS